MCDQWICGAPGRTAASPPAQLQLRGAGTRACNTCTILIVSRMRIRSACVHLLRLPLLATKALSAKLHHHHHWFWFCPGSWLPKIILIKQRYTHHKKCAWSKIKQVVLELNWHWGVTGTGPELPHERAKRNAFTIQNSQHREIILFIGKPIGRSIMISSILPHPAPRLRA